MRRFLHRHGRRTAAARAPLEWHLPLRRKTLHLHTEGFTIVQTAESRSADGNLCDASGQSWISVIGRLNEDQRECVHEAVVKSYRDSIQDPEALLQCQMTVFRLDSARVKVTSVDGNVKECVL